MDRRQRRSSRSTSGTAPPASAAPSFRSDLRFARGCSIRSSDTSFRLSTMPGSIRELRDPRYDKAIDGERRIDIPGALLELEQIA
jgi:hypothetical protein